MADKQPEKVKFSPLAAGIQKVLDGLVDGATSIIAHGATEASSALYSGNGFTIYGNGINETSEPSPLGPTSLDQLDAQAEQMVKDVAARQKDEPEQSQGMGL